MNGHIRNIPCSCGSGRKRKRCCGAPMQASAERESPFDVLDRMDQDFEEGLVRDAKVRLDRLRIAASIPKPVDVPCPECYDRGEVHILRGLYVECPHKCAPVELTGGTP